MKKIFSSIIMCFCLIGLCNAQTFKAEHIKTTPPKIEELVHTVSAKQYRSTLAETFFEMFVELFADIWALQTIYVNYDDYPYASNGKYIHFTQLEKAAQELLGVTVPNYSQDGDTNFKEAKNQFYRFALDTSIFFIPNKAAGNQTRFEGIIWKFFGPMFQIDTNANIQNLFKQDKALEISTDMILGLQFSIIQFAPFSLYWTFCWNHQQSIGNGPRNGIAFQLIARSYPARPVLLEWRGTIYNLLDDGHNDEKVTLESHLELGFMVNGPLEIFGAWRYFCTVTPDTSEYNGFEIGARYHF